MEPDETYPDQIDEFVKDNVIRSGGLVEKTGVHATLRSIRDDFAQAALAGLMANPAFDTTPQQQIVDAAFEAADLCLTRRLR